MSALLNPRLPIAVIAPSHAFSREKLNAGLKIARDQGYQLELLSPYTKPHRSFSATDSERLAHLNEALCSPRFSATWLIRGGSGLTVLLNGVHWSEVKARPVIGFSDATCLLNALREHATPIHGPVLHSLGQSDAASVAHLFALLRGERTPIIIGESWQSGHVSAPFVGGNLCLIAATCGTTHQLNAEGCLLFIEEIGEAAYKIDRMLVQLLRAGVFKGVKGIVLGEFINCGAPSGATWSLNDVLRERLLSLNVPLLAHLPMGHGPQNRAFQVGATATIYGHTLQL